MINEKIFDLLAVAPVNCVHHFLTFVPWYQYLPSKDFQNGCDIRNFQIFPNSGVKSDVPLVLTAIINDLLQLVGLLALGFVVYGGIKMMTSEGNPDSAAQARGAVVNALVGLAIAIVGVTFVNFLGNAIGK